MSSLITTTTTEQRVVVHPQTLRKLKELVDGMMDEGVVPDSYISFREKGNTLSLVTRWQHSDCEVEPCGAAANHLDGEGGSLYCGEHGCSNDPDWDEEADDFVTCATTGHAMSVTVYKHEGINLCYTCALPLMTTQATSI